MVTEPLEGGYTYTAPASLQPITTDALLLADFAKTNGGPVCELCCGGGIVSLLMARKRPETAFTGVDRDELAVETYRKNGLANGLRFTAVCQDASQAPCVLGQGVFAAVVANPPYFTPVQGATSPNICRARARQGEDFSLEHLACAAGKLLKNGGTAALCICPERLSELLCLLQKNGLEPKRLQLVAATASKPPFLALIEAKKQAKPGLRVLPIWFLGEDVENKGV